LYLGFVKYLEKKAHTQTEIIRSLNLLMKSFGRSVIYLVHRIEHKHSMI
jgi:hypothetical protein